MVAAVNLPNVHGIQVNNTFLPFTKEFRYLGVFFSTAHSTFLPHFQRVCNKLNSSLGMLYKHLAYHGMQDPSISYSLFKQFVFGSINFACGVWYPLLTKGQRAVFERAHLGFLRYCLLVPRRTPIEILYADMGAYPLEFFFSRIVFTFWNDLLALRDDHPCRGVFSWLLSNHTTIRSWIVRVRLMVLEYLPNFDGHGVIDITRWSRQYRSVFRNSLFASQKSVVRNFFTCFKTRIRYLRFLGFFRSNAIRGTYCRFRAGAHGLEIDTGRLSGTERSRRFCRVCHGGMVEDEEHFLFRCPAYDTLRRKYHDLFRVRRLAFLFNNTDQLRVGCMLKDFFDCRSSLLP